MKYIPFGEILDQLDLKQGDTVLVGSDILRLMVAAHRNGEKVDGNLMIDSLQRIVGESGTLLFPTFNWDFCNGTPFDVRNTPSKTGSLSALALKQPEFKRTQHPIYSFAVWGQDQERLCAMDNISAFGEDSPFAYLLKKKATMLLIGLHYSQGFTFVHYVEELEKVDYRYRKQFSGVYVDEQGNEEQRTYEMYVRDLERGVHSIFPDEFSERLESTGASELHVINGVTIYQIDLEKSFAIIQEEIRSNGAKLLYATAQ